MNCKACNTRMPTGGRICPHCGHAHPQSSFVDRPGQGASSPSTTGDGGSSAGRLSPSRANFESPSDEASDVEEVDVDVEVELPLEDALATRRGAPDTTGRSGRSDGSAATSTSKSPAKSARSDPRASARDRSARGASRRAATPPRDAAASGLLVPIDAEAMRHLIGEQPELLEPGLRVLSEEGRRRLGIAYGTEVGEIDLLARSEEGDWVVVMVVEGTPGPELVSDVLRRVGWVRKHLCEGGDGVRAILLLERMDEALGYAAAAVADTMDFRMWRVSIQFESIEV